MTSRHSTEVASNLGARVSGTPSPEKASERKRRKLRKGTNSCWACKKRKVKCIFSLPSDNVCNACQQRGSACITQEFPEMSIDAGSRQMGDRIVRVEALLNQLVGDSTSNSNSYPASARSDEDANRNVTAQIPYCDSESTLYKSQSDQNSPVSWFAVMISVSSSIKTC
jgi:hypothetical protein